MTFIVTYTAFSEAKADDVFAVLTDLENWPSWDVRVQRAHSHGSKKGAAGVSYTLKPSKGNEVTIQITKADNHQFNDVAKLEIGTIETDRKVEDLKAGGSLVTQTMRANIKDSAQEAFAEVFWEEWSQGIINSTKALAKAPVALAFLTKHKNVA